MVKNTHGGNKSKGFARKNLVKGSSSLRVSQNEFEIYAQVTKICGGAICQVVNLNGINMTCHIRGKFRGRGKRDNLIASGTWLLVGLREWEKEASNGKLLNCDVIEVYSESDKDRLKNSDLAIDWGSFITNDKNKICTSSQEEEIDVVFMDEKMQDFRSIIESQIAESQSGRTTTIVMEETEEEINIDDI